MGKMSERRRKANKMKREFAKMLKSLEIPKIRIPTPPTGGPFKSDKDYDRAKNREIIKKDRDDI